ncbi:hypothetical protein E5163_07060 [Marinicauda algicola]|uniref:Sulfotransferase n=1 Tax=Marinicauda algicola TaxID=2029849 RepID=A0A4S2H0X4_9PROT|nr:hypothetical protein [Marinicauda algicola]TGY88891.1 hypothetical protein E5163_07060 [Marinicauda algicola]
MTSQLSSDRLTAFASDPRLYPYSLDLASRRVLLLDLPLEAMDEASFLDERVLQSRPSGGWTGEDGFLALAMQAREPGEALGFIFHMGHCGSTLLARLLGHRGDGFALKEPLPLRELAEAALDLDTAWDGIGSERFGAIVQALLRSWARRPDGVERVIVKATSLTSGLAPDLLSAAPQSRALVLRLRLEPYLATLLAPQPLSGDLTAGARVRFRRLASAAGDPGWRLHALSPGELAAATWIAEAASLAALIGTEPDRTLALDFEEFLAEPAARLLDAARHVGLGWDEAAAEAAVESSIMHRYAKAPEHGFGPQERARVLADSRARNAEEIAKGQAFAGAALDRLPRLSGLRDWL